MGRVEHLDRLVPLTLVDAQEVGHLTRLEERHALRHLGIADDHARLRLLERPRLIERRDQSIDIVAVDPLRVPAEGLPFRREGLEAGDLGRWAVGLLVVDVDDADQVVELPMRGGERRLPRRALAELAIGEQVVDESAGPLALQPEAEADGDGEAMSQRAAADLDARGVARHRGHGQATVIAAVGLELLLGQDTSLDQRRVESDRVVPDREQEAVALFPARILRPVAERVEVGDRQHVGHAQGLRDVALALYGSHAQRVAADAVGALGERHVGRRPS